MTKDMEPLEFDFFDGISDLNCESVEIGGRPVGLGRPVYFIAEIGLNHNGSVDAAIDLMDIAVAAGVDAVKFQKRTLSDIYLRSAIDDPNSFEEGIRYLLPILKETEFSKSEYDQIYNYAVSKRVDFLCTPFDRSAVDFLRPYDLPAYKVASGDFNNIPLLEYLAKQNKPLILSTGMATINTIDQVARYIRKWATDCILLHSVSAYPTPDKDIHLSFLRQLTERYRVPIGFSSHEQGIDASVLAVGCGACLIERHITQDRNGEGPDHKSSLEPSELADLVAQIRKAEVLLGNPWKSLSHAVRLTKEALSKSLVAAVDIAAGETITSDMLCTKGPAKGLDPLKMEYLVGTKSKRALKRDDYFLDSDCEADLEISSYQPNFGSKWGFKCRFKDLDYLAEHYQPYFVECHFNDKDVEYKFDLLHRNKSYPFQLICHYPTYWERRVVNLASENERERLLHVDVVQKVIDKSRLISPHFQGEPTVVVHLGGMDTKPLVDNQKLIDLAYDSLRRLDWEGVTFLPENVPPRPWYFSGQWYDNAFCSVEEMISVCNEFKLEMCLDLSHAKLYTNLTGYDYDSYIIAAAPFTKHLHVSDASSVDQEGVQIGEGDVEFETVFRLLEEHGDLANMTWTPEIWQGHNDRNDGFLTAFKRLERIPQLRGEL